MIHHLGFNERWACVVVDLAPGERMRLALRSPCFFFVPEAQAVSLRTAGESAAGLALRRDSFGQAPGGEIRVANEAQDGPARLLLIHRRAVDGEPLAVAPLARHVTEIELEQRPGAIRLWSLLRHTGLFAAGWQLGVELVDIAARVPRHRHVHSAARVLVLEGAGRYGMHEDGVHHLHAGDVIDFPRDVSHGFDPGGGRFRILSLQDPPIDDDYVLEEDRDYDYHGSLGAVPSRPAEDGGSTRP